MNKSNITSKEYLHDKLLWGIDVAASVIRDSYGPKGANVSIQDPRNPGHIISNDADTIIQAMYCYDEVENAGLNFVKELSAKATKDSGEGRKTTVIMAETIFKSGIESKVKGMKLKEELDALVPKVLKSLHKQSQPIELEDVAKVASTSSRSKEMGDKIQEIYNEVGREGIITVEGSGTFDTYHTSTNGVVFKGAGCNPYFYNTKEKNATYQKPLIIISKIKISNEGEVNDLVAQFDKSDKNALIILADYVDPRVIGLAVKRNMDGQRPIVILEAPVINKEEIFEDFAKCVGADILEEEGGTNWKQLAKAVEYGKFRLGTCDKIIIDNEETLLLGIQDVGEHKKYLEERVNAKEHDANDAKRRLWRLNAKTAVLKLGAGSESELSYKLSKARDALTACRAALLSGICTGGGKALLEASKPLKMAGAEGILKMALTAPYAQLLANEGSGVDDELNTEGVYDACLVLTNAVKNAVSLAGTMLTLGADIRFRELTDQELQIKLASIKNQQMFSS